MSPDSNFGDHPSLGIGSALKAARIRVGMDIKDAEERTKIRARYLRALEAEDWEALPAPAYVRGFLRSYGEILEIDGEALADEFRRRHEGVGSASASPASEPMLRERRRAPGSRPPSRTPWIIGIAAGIIILLVILGSIGGDDDGGGSSDGEDAARELRKENRQGGGSDAKGLQPVGVTLETVDAVRVCLVGDGTKALLDGQMLDPGTEEPYPDDYKRYRLDIYEGGTVLLQSAGTKERIEADGDTSYEVDSRGIREIEYAGPDCP